MIQINKIDTNLLDCYILEPTRYGDDRGYFCPFYKIEDLKEMGIPFKDVVQANRSKSSKGVVRGLHFQKEPKCQAKIVEVIQGKAIDVVVDMRENSETFGKWTSVLLTEDNNRQLYVPRGFAHGFVSLEDNTIFQYLIDNDYAPELEDGILWNDPEIGINWEEIFNEYNITNPLLSDKDKDREPLSKCKVRFKRG